MPASERNRKQQSQNCRRNPEAELHATMAAFSREDSGQTPLKLGALGLSATCSFPARRLFVERELGYPPRKMKCDEYETWKSGIGAHAVSLVFSSAYPGSPGSLFGHTFLKFSRQPLATTQSKNLNHAVRFSSAEMLDYSLSFAAATGNAGPLAYFGYGLTGGFNGVFPWHPFTSRPRSITPPRDAISGFTMSTSRKHKSIFWLPTYGN